MLSKKEQDFVNGLRVCRFGSIDERGFPHIVPLNVSADDNHLFVSASGRRLDHINSNPKVCVVVDGWPNKQGVMIRGVGDVVERAGHTSIRIRPVRKSSWNYDVKNLAKSEPKSSQDRAPFDVYIEAVVVKDGNLLAMRRIVGPSTRRWAVPGGFSKPEEPFAKAVARIVEEMTTIKTLCEGLVGIRHLAYGSKPLIHEEVHLVHRARWVAGRPTADGVQADAAEFMTLDEFKEKAALFSPLSLPYSSVLEKALSANECLQEIGSSQRLPETALNIAYL
jgi:ADP-ribose pyrophosphatase YjhB (NUDIX family)